MLGREEGFWDEDMHRFFLGGRNRVDFSGGLGVDREKTQKYQVLKKGMEGKNMRRDSWNWGWWCLVVTMLPVVELSCIRLSLAN